MLKSSPKAFSPDLLSVSAAFDLRHYYFSSRFSRKRSKIFLTGNEEMRERVQKKKYLPPPSNDSAAKNRLKNSGWEKIDKNEKDSKRAKWNGGERWNQLEIYAIPSSFFSPSPRLASCSITSSHPSLAASLRQERL
ncbi:hypothetical protein CDAR_379031 [Caerostris darwini]|uniref:Uncharacterized protein n=1 Tax=Caerostris darwini TaxID=1538125 RepID=A0AAV4TZ08_9ARAC|nr:hypothetical protein CDAR_379031 [Caerostris darwini]